ncbi:MAG TPA: putative quinol monooxygenase [Anaeromyxobacteraceae bacterium]|nr:putative quinol monooxygenase [Anaeromyxobacteraceae bacterium]
MADEKVTVVARFKVKPGLEGKAKQALLDCLAPTRSEAGCINYDLHQSVDDERSFMIHENWASKQALEVHLQTPHLKALLQRADELFSGPVDISLWRTIS